MDIYRISFAAAMTAVAALTSCGHPPADDPRMVSEWMHTLYGIVRSERLSPPVASRFLGYASVALYEGTAAADPAAPSLAGVLNGLPALPAGEKGRRYDPTLVAVEAERLLLDTLLAEGLPASRATLAGLADSLIDARMALGIPAAVAIGSRQLGRQIGVALLAWSRTDGFDGTRGRAYSPPNGPEYWRNDTPGQLYAAQNLSGATEFVGLDNPANLLRPGSASDRGMVMNRPKRPGLKELPPVNMAGATEPYWGELRPFVLTAWNECPLPPPPAYGTAAESPLHQQAKVVYDTKTTLTPEQRAIALFWADNPGESGTPTGHWVAIASQMIGPRKLSAANAARLFALTAVAQADAFISSWGYKYTYNLLRPRTYIRRVIDPAWEPQISTPPFPEHPAGHSTQSAAAASVLTALLGVTPFDDRTGLAIGHPVRRFASFTEAAHEAGLSRIYGGIHFPSGDSAGRSLGECIGARVVERAPARWLP
jgi:hypothetical protein